MAKNSAVYLHVPTTPAILVICVGEATDVRAMRSAPGQSIALTEKPAGSSAELNGDEITADTVGWHTFVVDNGARSFRAIAVPLSVDTDERLRGDGSLGVGRRIVASLLAWSPARDVASITPAHPFPSVRAADGTTSDLDLRRYGGA